MSNDQPQFIWGKPNPNWKGPQPAAGAHSNDGTASSVSGDFSHPSGLSKEERIEYAYERMDDFLEDYFREGDDEGYYTFTNTATNEKFYDVDSFLSDYEHNLGENGGDYTALDNDYQVSVNLVSGNDLTDRANYASLSTALQNHCNIDEPNITIPIYTLMDDTDKALATDIQDAVLSRRDFYVINDTIYDMTLQEDIENLANDYPARRELALGMADNEMQDAEYEGLLDELSEDQKDSLREQLEDHYESQLDADAIADKIRERYNEDPDIEFDYETWSNAAFAVLEEGEGMYIPDMIDEL